MNSCFLYNAHKLKEWRLIVKNQIMTFLKGLFVGSTMLVPGVSGGSMAMILGIYDRLIHAVSSFRKDKRNNVIFLIIFSIGGLSGMLLFAKPMLTAIEQWEKPMLYFFIGIVVGGIPLIIKKANMTSFHIKYIAWILMGIIGVLLLAQMPVLDMQEQDSLFGFIMLVVAGFVSAIALVLPGISVSYMLLLLGMYDTTMKAISTCYIPFLLPLGFGVILGIVSTTKLLEMLMAKYTQPTYLIIFGFVLGSVYEILPGIPKLSELFLCVGSFAVGYLIITLMMKFDQEE